MFALKADSYTNTRELKESLAFRPAAEEATHQLYSPAAPLRIHNGERILTSLGQPFVNQWLPIVIPATAAGRRTKRKSEEADS